MKRTKQAYFRQNPSLNETKDISGVTFVFGQDNNYHQRTKQYQQLQKQFLDEQVAQKQQIKKAQNQNKNSYDQQLLQVNRYRGQLQVAKHGNLTNMEKACDNHNLQQAQERNIRQKLQRQQELQAERREIQMLNQRNVKRYIPGKKI